MEEPKIDVLQKNVLIKRQVAIDKLVWLFPEDESINLKKCN